MRPDVDASGFPHARAAREAKDARERSRHPAIAPSAVAAANRAGAVENSALQAPVGGIGPDLAVVLPAVLAELAPRVRVEPGRVWVDARGLAAQELAAQLLESLSALGVEDARAGVSEVAVAAWAACSRYGVQALAEDRVSQAPGRRDIDGETAGQRDGRRTAAGARARGRDFAAERSPSVFVVPSGREREYLSAFPLDVLLAEEADARLLGMLADVGVHTCGQLGALEREVVEVRFGAEGVRLWRLARADDARLLFLPTPPELPQASLEFLDYVVTDPERLAFTVNALLGSVCDALRERGQHARRMLLVLELSGGGRREQGLRPGRPTASRAAWLRLARAALDRTTLTDAVAGVRIEVEAVEPAGVRQGDLFDAGFATAPAVEAAVMRLLEAQGEVVVRPEVDAHPLAERRVTWTPVAMDEVVGATTPDVQALAGSGMDEGESPPTDGGMARGREGAIGAIGAIGATGAIGAIGATGAMDATGAAGATGTTGAVIAPVTPHRSWAAVLPQERTAQVVVVPSRRPAVPPSAVTREQPDTPPETTAALTLQLLNEPRPILVETVLRRDHQVPIRYRDVRSGGVADGGAATAGPPADGRWHQVVSSAGPDRVSGGVWEDAYAREYFQATTADGALVWLFRDARRDTWYLHGWWD